MYRIQPAQLITSPDIIGMEYDDTETFSIGAPLTLTTGLLTEETSPITSTSATLIGIALERVDTGRGYNPANSSVTVHTTGQTAKLAIAHATSANVWKGSLVSGSAVVVAPAAADIGVSYGLASYSTTTQFGTENIWYVDKSLTTTDACVTIIGFDAGTSTENSCVYFKFVPGSLMSQ